MKNYITIKMSVEDINSLQSELLIGIPSLVAYMSFIENLILKSSISNNKRPENVFIGISMFQYKEFFEKSSENVTIKNGNIEFGSVNISPKALIDTEITFDIDSDLDNNDIYSTLYKCMQKLKFCGGMIKEFEIFINKEKNKALRKMFPTFIINSDQEKISNIDFLTRELLIKNKENFKDKNIIITGYSFLSNKFDNDNLNYEMVYGEPIYRLIYKEALTNKNISDLKGWSWDLTSDKQILINQKGE